MLSVSMIRAAQFAGTTTAYLHDAPFSAGETGTDAPLPHAALDRLHALAEEDFAALDADDGLLTDAEVALARAYGIVTP